MRRITSSDTDGRSATEGGKLVRTPYLEFGRVVLLVLAVLPVSHLRVLVPLAGGEAADGGVACRLGGHEAFGQRRHALAQRV